MPRNSVLAALGLVAALALPLPAQIWNPSGDILALTAAGGYFLVNANGTGASAPVNWGTFVQPMFLAFEFDQIRGQLYGASKPTPSSDIEIHRSFFAGPNVIAQQLVMTIPNTGNLEPLFLYREIFGSYLLLSRDLNLVQRQIHRLGIATSSGIATLIPASSMLPSFITDIASDTQGAIYATGPVGSGAGQVFRIAPDGVGFSVPWCSNEINPFSIAINHFDSDRMAVGGQNRTLIPPGPLNFYCGPASSVSCGTTAGHQFVGNCSFGVAGVVHVTYEQGGANWLLAENCAGGIAIQRFSAPGCLSMNASFVWFPPAAAGGITKITRCEPGVFQPLFGYPCPTTAVTMPLMTQLTPPLIGTPWVLQLTQAVPNDFVSIQVGFSDAMTGGGVPLPFALDPAAVCALFVDPVASANFTVDAAGSATFILNVPNDPNLIGLVLFAQWIGIGSTSALFDTSAVRSVVM